MESDLKDSADKLGEALSEVQGRFEKLAASRDGERSGVGLIARGLSLLIEEAGGDAALPPDRLAVVLEGLGTLAGLMSEEASDDEVEAEGPAASEDDPAAKFREMFRKDARKRLSGLSISMMGIFTEEQGAQALEQTGDHLHALKGSAAMVGLEQFAGLAGAMEKVVLEMKRRFGPERTWPTRALMRGFHLLEDAVADARFQLDEEAVSEVIGGLRMWRSDAMPASASPAGRTTMELPVLSEMEEADLSVTPEVAEYQGPLEKRILVVDDVSTIAASVGFILSELDVPVEMAEHGEQALEMLRERPYSLVISDVSMPRMDGIALTRTIRANEDTSEIPVILLTSLDRPDERDAGIEAGATDYLIKGAIGGGELIGRVTELLEFAPDVPARARERDHAQRRILIAEDVETIAASIAFVLSEGPFEIEIAQNGQKALARLREDTYDLLLSDVQMPEMGGMELLEMIRNDEALADLPVILLTSLQDPDVQQEALDAGANRFLIKGEVGGEALLGIVSEVADKRR